MNWNSAKSALVCVYYVYITLSTVGDIKILQLFYIGISRVLCQ